MTYSIIARCPRTNKFGVGSTTFSMACGRRYESVRPNVGISKSQSFYLRYVDPLALNMLGQGYVPQHILEMLRAEDADFGYRQFGIIDAENRIAVHTGSDCGPWAGHRVGPYYAAYGNGLAGPQTVDGLISGFMREPDAPLEDRLLMALEAGRDAGGQMSNGVPRPERSAWIRVVGQLPFPEIDLRVDLHHDTVAELRRLLTEFKKYSAYYARRDSNPGALDCQEEEFSASLEPANP